LAELEDCRDGAIAAQNFMPRSAWRDSPLNTCGAASASGHGLMRGDDIRWHFGGPLIAIMLLLGGCAGNRHLFGGGNDEDEGINVYPTTYKADILGGMHAYLNDPTGIRDAAVSEPMLKSVGNETRYVVCVQFNGKLNGTYAGDKVFAAVFLVGHFDHFVEKAQEQCASVTYTPFPELQKLPR
jgi:hypothetical protein